MPRTSPRLTSRNQVHPGYLLNPRDTAYSTPASAVHVVIACIVSVVVALSFAATPTVATTAPSSIAPAPPSSTIPSTPALPPASATTTIAAPTPSEYLRDAADFIERYSYYRSQVNWQSIRAAAERKAAAAASLSDVHPILIDLVKALDDRHSSFVKPVLAVEQTAGNAIGYGFVATWPSRIVASVTPNTPAARSGLKVGDRIDKIDGKTPGHNSAQIVIARDRAGDVPAKITLTVSRRGLRTPRKIVIERGQVTLVSVPQATAVERPSPTSIGTFGIIEVPGIVGDPAAQTKYANELQQTIRTSDTSPRCGWVIDLRRNRGGYIYAMLAGLGPLLGRGPVGGLVDASGKRTMWSYENGAALVNGEPTIRVTDPYNVSRADPPIAVLTSRLTASAGEAIAISFRGRAATRSFGDPTNGLTTFNVRKVMADGAFLDIVNGVEIDRLGNTYGSSIAPDQTAPVDFTTIGTDRDATLNTAINWLATQPGCATA